jgi:hypothetical protein
MAETFNPVFPRRLYFNVLHPFTSMLHYYAVWIAEIQWFGSFGDIGFYNVALNCCCYTTCKYSRPITLSLAIERQPEPANSISDLGPWSVALGPCAVFQTVIQNRALAG